MSSSSAWSSQVTNPLGDPALEDSYRRYIDSLQPCPGCGRIDEMDNIEGRSICAACSLLGGLAMKPTDNPTLEAVNEADRYVRRAMANVARMRDNSLRRVIEENLMKALDILQAELEEKAGDDEPRDPR